ncbi:unnamed protein product [Ambrosiozyma monospora]|uniref:Unnamed protein product n=1 Tax=Ambrosiozyma monospora TaxID=43982 RepID=A0A9W6T215_AMBMO|nr:unnamed protein product [Ambrosiozyma monospora]
MTSLGTTTVKMDLTNIRNHNERQPSVNTSASSISKTLDLEPNPFEQSFAGGGSKANSVTPTNHNSGSHLSLKDLGTSNNANTTTTNGHGLSAKASISKSLQPPNAHPPGMSPPILTPGGTRRLPTNTLPPLQGLVSPGGTSLPGTPGIWNLLGASFPPSAGGAQSNSQLPFTLPNGSTVGGNGANAAGASNPLASPQQLLSSFLTSKKLDMTPNESSLRTGFTPGGNAWWTHTSCSHCFRCCSRCYIYWSNTSSCCHSEQQ